MLPWRLMEPPSLLKDRTRGRDQTARIMGTLTSMPHLPISQVPLAEPGWRQMHGLQGLRVWLQKAAWEKTRKQPGLRVRSGM